MTERWKDVPGYEGRYQVSNLGHVRSVNRIDPAGRRLRGRVLRPSLGSHGYPVVALHNYGQRSFTVHALVARVFLGPAPFADAQVCHNDGDRTNPVLSNLRWDTGSANERDKLLHGTNPNAVKTHCPAGHEYSTENTYVFRGGRSCRKCHKEALIRYRDRRSAAARARRFVAGGGV